MPSSNQPRFFKIPFRHGRTLGLVLEWAYSFNPRESSSGWMDGVLMSDPVNEAWLESFYEAFEHEHGRPPTEREVAEAAIRAEAEALSKHEGWIDQIAKGDDEL